MLNNFIAWLKKPNPDTVLLKYWQSKRFRAKAIIILEAKQQGEQYRQLVATKAYLLWEADGKPEGKDEYYWELAIDHLEGNHFSPIYKLYYKLEKQILEPAYAWIDKQALFAILGKLGNLAVVVAIVTFVFGENVRRKNEVFSAWQTITSAHEQSGSGGRIKALQFLNSRPLRFPYIGWTIDLFGDKEDKDKGTKTETCKEKLVFGNRWQREPLVALSAPNGAYLAMISLCAANLVGVNLQDADLWKANLQDANLSDANLQNATLNDTNLQDADLMKANLQDANLWKANLQDANLSDANLQNATLSNTNLQDVNLKRANLQDANLKRANFQDAFLWGIKNLTYTQIKSACFWDNAIYKGEWKPEKKTFDRIEPDNTNYIEKLKQDAASNPKQPVDCSRWQTDS